MKGIEIRRQGLQDTDLVLSVGDGVFDGPVRPDQVRALLQEPGQLLVAALAADGIVGMASGVRLRQPDKRPAFYLDELGVHADWQGHGIGTALGRFVLQTARQMGCETVWLATEADNDRARSLYAHLGGVEQTGVVVWSFANCN